MLENKLKILLKQTALSVSEAQQQQLIGLVKLLHKWNKAYNLTSIRDPQDMLIKHIMDSLVVSPYLTGNCFIDVGTGPGLPGLPLAIINPEKEFFLLDSIGKRIHFIKNTLRELNIHNVKPILSRVEEYQPEMYFDGVLSRAFASLDDMVSWCNHLVSKEGRLYALKGQYQAEEINNIKQPIEKLEKIKLTVPELIGERHLLILTIKPT